MSKNKGWVGFDWIMPGAVSMVLFERGADRGPSTTIHMTPDEADMIARRLSAWAEYKRARDLGVRAKQPGNHCTLQAAPTFRR